MRIDRRGTNPCPKLDILARYFFCLQIEFDLEEYADKDELLQAIRKTRYLQGSTNSADALRTTREIFAKQGRDGVPLIGIFMTDGQSQDTAGTARAADEVL